jgi:adenylate cyclase
MRLLGTLKNLFSLRRIRRAALSLAVPFAFLIAGLAITTFDPGNVISDMRLRVFDYYQRFQPRAYTPVPVRYVDIDEDSLKSQGQWPWPRSVMARMVDELTRMGAATVVFDVVFAEPDRTSPKRFLADLPKDSAVDGIVDALARLPDNDDVFAEAIARSRVVTGFVLTAAENDKVPARKAGFAELGDSALLFLPRFAGAAVNLPNIEAAAKGNGSFNLVADFDSVIRGVPLVVAQGDTLYPSLVAEALRVAVGASTIMVKSSGANMEQSFGAKTGIASIKIGPFVIPTNARGEILVHYTPATRERVISARDVLEGRLDRAAVEGQIIFVGTSAAGLLDLRPSPLNPAMPGVEAHVQAVEQVLLGAFLKRPDWASGAERLFMLVVGVLLLVALRVLSPLWAAVLTVVAALSAVGVSWTLYADERLLTDPISPSVVIAGVYVSGSIMRFLRTEAERTQVRQAFGQYLSPALVERLAQNPDLLQLGGETRHMTFLFSDVRGFTTISERFKTNPQGLTRLINRFLTPMTDAILARQGTIDKYMGDCVMAFWNAPLDDARHVQNSCASALAMISALDALNGQLAAEAEAEGHAHTPLSVGIGINTGDCVVGNMGSEQRFDYSVLGDAVNLASRLEGQSKYYQVTVVLGEETARVASDEFAVLELDLIAVKGKAEAVHIFTLLGADDVRSTGWFQALIPVHAAMIAAYRAQDWAAAAAGIAACRGHDVEGRMAGFYDLMDERLVEYAANPPGAGWSGVYVATSK